MIRSYNQYQRLFVPLPLPLVAYLFVAAAIERYKVLIELRFFFVFVVVSFVSVLWLWCNRLIFCLCVMCVWVVLFSWSCRWSVVRWLCAYGIPCVFFQIFNYSMVDNFFFADTQYGLLMGQLRWIKMYLEDSLCFSIEWQIEMLLNLVWPTHHKTTNERTIDESRKNDRLLSATNLFVLSVSACY